MKPRQGLWMALVGFVIIVLCAIPAQVIPDTGTWETGGSSDITVMGIVLFYVGGFVGLVVMIVGLIMAGVGTFVKRGKP
jgi:hypothetical protein